ncbi:hypothetical protein MPNT_90056 [Candidatus Methylacidithermus pantelleriae]|uniref:Uncharacterized protein n=1 Tax=Candidatus Methylacidithermus pantelleriae TaxID=2744239 RepID=A0A8J2FPW5_9BACT|nr:hypothetical protein MPNT_90056 [Candidatus Methylacidithermus pantelleriae]
MFGCWLDYETLETNHTLLQWISQQPKYEEDTSLGAPVTRWGVARYHQGGWLDGIAKTRTKTFDHTGYGQGKRRLWLLGYEEKILSKRRREHFFEIFGQRNYPAVV